MEESLYDPKALDDLEIVLSSATDGKGYIAYIRQPDWEIAFTRLSPLPFQTLEKAPDPLVYGEQLFQWLFQGEVAEAFSYARKLAGEPSRGFKAGTRLRIRLSLDPKSVELRQLLWESLYTPDGLQPFSLTTAFSRFMHVSGPQNLPIRKRPLRMLLIISSPEGVDQIAFDEFNRELEKSIIRDARRSIGPLLIVDSLKESPTLARIQDTELQVAREDGDGYHIVHLLAPVSLRGNQGYLLLPDDTGKARKVSAKDIVRVIVPLSSPPPRLVLLTAPLTAQRPGSETLIDLAQMLIEAGVQAVVAIQSPISAPTLFRFIEHFYAALMRTGGIDIAMAEARTAIYNPDQWEWTHPVLYMRVPDGRLFQPLPETLESEITEIKIEGIR
jgi:hypothetical protein